MTCNHILLCCMLPRIDTQYLQTLNWSVTLRMHQLLAGAFASWSCMPLSNHMCTDMPASFVPDRVACECATCRACICEPAYVCSWTMRQHHIPAEAHCCMPCVQLPEGQPERRVQICQGMMGKMYLREVFCRPPVFPLALAQVEVVCA